MQILKTEITQPTFRENSKVDIFLRIANVKENFEYPFDHDIIYATRYYGNHFTISRREYLGDYFDIIINADGKIEFL